MSVEDELRALEERLLQLETRKSPEELETLLADDFVEFGSSGRIFDKPRVIAALAAETKQLSVAISDFRARMLADDVALVTYRCVSSAPAATTLRSSIWRQEGVRWRIAFHQGTPAARRGTQKRGRPRRAGLR